MTVKKWVEAKETGTAQKGGYKGIRKGLRTEGRNMHRFKRGIILVKPGREPH